MSVAVEFSKEEKNKARLMVRNAVKAGKLIKGPCEVCGTTNDVHGHHDDYAKPLDVRWLCNFHHGKHHAEESISPSVYVCPLCGEEEDHDINQYAIPLCLVCRTAYELIPDMIKRGWMDEDGNPSRTFPAVITKLRYLRSLGSARQRSIPYSPIVWPEGI
jgi:hypothetical protein